MKANIADATNPPVPDGIVQAAHELPHGLIIPPERVKEIVAAEKSKFPPNVFTQMAEERLKNDLTLQFFFEKSGHEVLYRSTPDGPEVLAVGFAEIQHLRRTAGQADLCQLSTWMP